MSRAARERRAGLTYDEKMAVRGYLPANFFASPKSFELDRSQKERLSRMFKNQSAEKFKSIYGFKRLAVKK